METLERSKSQEEELGPGQKKSMKKTQKEAFRIKGEMLNRAKPLSDNNRWAEEGQRKSPIMKHSNQKGAL